jgi:hypothetical protein
VSLRVYIKKGPHISGPDKDGNRRAFGKYVGDYELIPYIGLDDFYVDEGKVPDDLARVAVKFTIHVNILGVGVTAGDREDGEYVWGDARGTTCHLSGGSNGRQISLDVSGTNLRHVKELIQRVQAGYLAPKVRHNALQTKGPALRVREAAHQLIVAIATWYDQIRLLRLS